MVLSWMNPSLKTWSRLLRPKTNRGRFRPTVAPLDERVLPAAITATFSAAAAQLRVVGDDLDNTIVVSRTAAGTILVNNGAIAILGDPGATVANTRSIMITGAGGNDVLALDEANGPMPAASIFGGTGNDTLIGGSGVDFISGESGTDLAFLGAGDDTFQWNPGDGSDSVEGQGGRDVMVFNGSDVAETFDLSANGTRARFTRDVGGITMDLNAVEEIDLNALGGADTVTVNDQSATGLNTFNVDLDGSAATGFGDNQADAVTINGTDGNDVGQIRSIGTTINATVSAIPFVNITDEDGLDALTVNTRGGNDMLDASDLAATNASQLIKLTEIGGTGTDTLIGSQGADTFVWNPGDGSDVIDGGDNPDTLIFNGSDVAEKFDVSASGSRVRLTRDVGGVTMDLGGIETFTVNALGGADTVTVNDLTGTGVVQINLDLSATAGSTTGDGQADSVIVNGRNAADRIPLLGSLVGGTGVVLVNGGFLDGSGLPYFMAIRATEGANDTLTINSLGGNDTVDASVVPAGLIGLTVNGGAGSDTMFGSPGADFFGWNPGDGSDTIDGGDGADTLIFNGSDQAERFDLSSNGSRVRLTRDLGGVTMDVGGVESITVNPLGGADTVAVNDLTGVPPTRIDVNLAGAIGGPAGDGQADTIIASGSNGVDNIPVSGFNAINAGLVFVGGDVGPGALPYLLEIRGTEGALDTLTVNALGGNDTVDAEGLPVGAIGLTVNGGAGSDTMVGSPGDDTFVWNPGDGSDTIDGQAGNDLLTFNGADVAENFAIARNGSHVLLTRDVGNVTMDLGSVEGILLNALGGADRMTVNDLTGTGLIKVQLNLANSARTGDGQADQVTVNGTNDVDDIHLAAIGGLILVDGLFPSVRITGSDGTSDRLTVNALGGNDTVDAANLPAGLIGLTVNLGDGEPGAPRVAGVVVNGGATQRSLVTQLQVAFDQHITLPANPADAFRLVRQGDGATVALVAAVDDTGAGTVVTLTFTGGAIDPTLANSKSLADGRYTLTVVSDQIGGPNGTLDGDNSGTGGGDFVLTGDPAANGLFRLYGDSSGNGVVNVVDLAAFRAAFGAVVPPGGSPFDVNGDGVIDVADLNRFRVNFGAAV